MRLLATLAAFLLLLAPSAKAPVPVDLELVLAVDVSRSIDDEEGRLQREGYMAAFTNPRVIEAIQGGSLGAIAVSYVEWASYEYQRTVIPWMLIGDGESAAAFAEKICRLPRVSQPLRQKKISPKHWRDLFLDRTEVATAESVKLHGPWQGSRRRLGVAGSTGYRAGGRWSAPSRPPCRGARRKTAPLRHPRKKLAHLRRG